MLAGKKGITHLHVGSASTGLAPLRLAVAASGGALPAEHLLPTHCSSRGPVLLAEAREWIERYGGRVDFTADGTGANDTLAAVLDWHAAPGGGGLLSRVSISTDAFGSFPEFDSDGKLVSPIHPMSLTLTCSDQSRPTVASLHRPMQSVIHVHCNTVAWPPSNKNKEYIHAGAQERNALTNSL